MAQQSVTVDAGPSYRIKPSIPVAIGVVITYAVLFLGVGVSSGIKYADWFDTTHNAYRTAVLGLVVGSVFLIAFLAYARWDILWKDPERLPMSPLLWTLVGLFVAVTVVRFAGVAYSEMSGSLILAIVVASILVGFAEETLFRGIFLRAMREGNRPEGQAALWTAVAFGLFHLPNAFMGVGAVAVLQVFLAAGSGLTLYVFRRFSTLIVVAMVAHGAWDMSTFMDGQAGQGVAHDISLSATFLASGLGLIAMFVLLRRDRHIAMTPAGIVSVESGSEKLSPV